MACSDPQNNKSLSYGVLNKILNGHNFEQVQNVVLQILGYKEIPGGQNARFRLLLNDGEILFSYAILASSLNHLIFDKSLEKFTIFELKNYAMSELEGSKKVIVCVDIEVLVPGSEINIKIEKKVNLCSNKNECGASAVENVQSSVVPTNPSTSRVTQNWDTARTAENNQKSRVCSIANISPYMNKWTIKAYVYYKTPLNSYISLRGQGQFFSFYLSDDTGKIKATAFNNIAERLFESVEVFKTYFVSGATVKVARENISFTGDFELIIDDNTKVEPDGDALTSLPDSIFKFHTIEEILSLPKESYTDVIGICMHVSDTTSVITKLNKEVVKRNFILLDRSKNSISVTLWNAQANNFDGHKNEVIAIKNAKITSYQGCSLCVESTSMIYTNPAIKEAESMKSWFQSLSPTACSQIASSSQSKPKASQVWKTLLEVRSDSEDNTKWPMYYKVKATIVMVNKKCLYQACPTVGCSKKVDDLGNGKYKCSKCNADFNTFCWTLFLQLEIADLTGSHWAVAFQEMAEKLIGMSSGELSKIRDEDQEKFIDVLNSLNLKSCIFELRSQFEAFSEDVQLKTSILNFYPIDLPVYAEKLFSDIEKFGKILKNS